MLDKSGYYIRRGGPAHTCPAGLCHSTDPGFRCRHQTGARHATDRTTPSTAAAALTAEVVAAFTTALAAAASRRQAAQTRRDLADDAAFGSVAYRQWRRPWSS